MNIFDFITQEELDEAPEESSLAFTQLVGHAQNRLAKYFKEANEINDSYLRTEAQHSFMNITIGLAKAYKIEPFSSMDVPVYDSFNYRDYDQFKADLDHYMTQLVVANSIKSRTESVKLSETAKDKIRSYVHGLKTAIDNSDFTESKKEVLHEKLKEFETAIDKNRLSLVAVTKFAFVVLAVPGSLWASYDAVTKLTNNILQIVGEAKATQDDERKLPDPRPMPALSPPREERKKQPREDLDDEIPF